MAMRHTVPALLVALVLAGASTRGAAQPAADSTAYRLGATRSELEARLEQLRQQIWAARPARWMAAETTYIRRRLEAGDLRTGDRVLIAVEDPLPLGPTPERPMALGKSQEQQLSDTFTVGPAGEIVLPGVGPVSLHGVLRAELEPYLAGKIGHSIRDPVVHAWPLVNLGVTGEVARPGFYAIQPNALVSGLLAAAGGPTKDAKLSNMKVERDGKAVWGGKALRQAVEQGRTLDQLWMQPGDVLDVPTKHSLDSLFRPLQFLALLGSITVAVYAIASHIRAP
jgi:protein involved in polysaccharide export with SLBB domain